MTARRSTTIVRWLGALALLSVGIDHIYEYYVRDYQAIPTIGTLFLLNFASALIVAAGLRMRSDSGHIGSAAPT
jgi:hypothetical protein